MWSLPPNVSQLIALEKHGRSQWLPQAVQEDGNTQKSPLMGSLRKKEWQHPVLEVYYFHISQYVCEPLGPL